MGQVKGEEPMDEFEDLDSSSVVLAHIPKLNESHTAIVISC